MLLAAAIVAALQAHPLLAAHVVQQGHLGKLLAHLEGRVRQALVGQVRAHPLGGGGSLQPLLRLAAAAPAVRAVHLRALPGSQPPVLPPNPPAETTARPPEPACPACPNPPALPAQPACPACPTRLPCLPNPPALPAQPACPQEPTVVGAGSEPSPAPSPLPADELGGSVLRVLHQLAADEGVQESLAMAQVGGARGEE